MDNPMRKPTSTDDARALARLRGEIGYQENPPVEAPGKAREYQCGCGNKFREVVGNPIEAHAFAQMADQASELLEESRNCHVKIEALESEVTRLREGLKDALEGLEDMFPYVGEYFQEKWDHQGYIDRAKEILGGGGEPKEQGCP